MFSVRVINGKRQGVSGVRVKLEFKGVTRGMSMGEYTDSQGYAKFSGYDPGDVLVYVDGASCGTYPYRDGGSINITR